MNANYSDIRSRISAPPVWFDANGVPRYEPFHPRMLPNIYADEAVLYETACQACERRFLVAESTDMHERVRYEQSKPEPRDARLSDSRISRLIFESWADGVFYGDPPSHMPHGNGNPGKSGCIGESMTTVDNRLIVFWYTDERCDWHAIDLSDKTAAREALHQHYDKIRQRLQQVKA